MKITRESTGDLTARIRMEIGPEDYAAAVEKQITDYKRKANLPGFRPGHVPTGLVRKMYGKAILADEVNRLISDSLTGYIRDEKLDILGNPIPNMEMNQAIDFENQESFDFYFDLGLTPAFTIPVDKDLNIDHLVIAVDDSMVEKYIDDTRKRFGTPVNAGEESETPETSDGKKPEPVIQPADMTPGFFDLVYPGMDLQTEEEFREQVRRDASSSFNAETEKMLFGDIIDALVKNTEIPLPDEFLKRWLAENNEGKYTPGDIEKNYTAFADSMKWQLIENRLIRDNNIVVKDEDIRDYIRLVMLRQINVTDQDPEMAKRYESVVDSLMQNEEQVKRINDQLYNARLMDYFKAHIVYHRKEVSYDDYIRIASEKHARDHAHDALGHDHHHDHEHTGHDHDHGDHDHDHEPHH